MKYETTPTIKGVNLSSRFDMSLSVLSFFAQNTIIAIGSIEANTIEIDSKRMNLAKLNWPFSNDNTIDIIRNSGMHMIGGFVNVDIALAIFNLSIILP